MSNVQCQHCGSTNVDGDPSRADSVCMTCGLVLEDSGIVTEVQFAQDSRGVTRAVGQLVNSEDGMPHGFGQRYGLGRESRAITLKNAKQSIQVLASKLKLQPHYIETAFQFYKVALSRQLTKGRKSTHVIAACVYMVCRNEKSHLMLLDISDVLQISVYELGKTYLKLSSALCINSPALDPSIYIHRFARELNFGSRQNETAVALTASRLVQRMKKDWLHTGRRPSGLCGAALLVAARLHDFNKSVEEIIKVVKVCQATVRKRLVEFSETPSSRLTLNEFMTIDLEEEQDPPAFKNARKKLQQELEDEGRMKQIKTEVTEIQKLIEKALDSTKKRSRYSKFAAVPENTQEVDLLIAQNTAESLKTVIDTDAATDSGISQLTPLLMKESRSVSEDKITTEPFVLKEPEPTAESIGLKESIEDCMKIPGPSSEAIDDRLDVTGLKDEELDNYLMDPTEYEKKDVFWRKCNADYLEELKEKEERKAREEEENANKPEKKRKRRPKRGRIEASTAGEALEKMLQQKKISFKLNYDVLKTLNPEETLSESAVTKTENDVTAEEITPVIRRNIRSRIKPKLPMPVPSNIKKGMSDIIDSTRKKEMLAAMKQESSAEIQITPSKKLKTDEEQESEQMPLETIILDEENNPEQEEEIIEDDEEEEELGSDEDGYFNTGLLNVKKEEKAPYDYDDFDEYGDDYDD